MATLKSQLAVNAAAIRATAPKAPESSFGQFVLGDIKGGSHAHEYRMTVVSAAIREALKGNSRAYLEAQAIATGNSKKAKSYFDGFAAVGLPARIAYTGKLSDPANKDIVQKIDEVTASLSADFECAFLTRFHAPAEPKARAKKGKSEPVADDSAASAASTGDSVTMDVSAVISAAATAVSTGAALAEEVELLRQALAAYDAAQLLKAMESSAANSEPVAQAA